MFLFILWFLFFKWNFFQCNWHIIRCLHFKCILWWILTNVSTRVATPSIWHKTFPSPQKPLWWLFAIDSIPPICVALDKHLSDFYHYQSRPSHKWNHIGCALSHLTSFTQHNVWDSFMLLGLSGAHLFLLLSSNPL